MLKNARLVGSLLLLSLLTPLIAMGSASALAVAQSYNASSALQPGNIVDLTSKGSSTVMPANQDESKMFGVVINPSSSPVTLSATSSSQVFVVTNGAYPVLVSTQGGAIRAGDYITVSSLNGIGMKATSNDSTVLGRATSSFSGNGDSLGTAKLKGTQNSTTVQLGTVDVDINVAHNPLIKPVHNSLPSFLQSAGKSIANKQVSATRAYIGLVILAISAIIAGGMLYAGVRSSIISIGRNPLSKKSIIRGLAQVTLTSVMVFAVGLIAVYLILRL